MIILAGCISLAFSLQVLQSCECVSSALVYVTTRHDIEEVFFGVHVLVLSASDDTANLNTPALKYCLP